jgi:hypothetical protein
MPNFALGMHRDLVIARGIRVLITTGLSKAGPRGWLIGWLQP